MGPTPKNKAIDAEYLLNQLKNLDKNILETKYVQEKDVKDTYTATDENPISGKGVSVAVNTLQQDINGKSNIGHKHTKSEITDFPTSMTPTAHTHDDRYYTESEINTKLNSKLNTSLKGSANGLAELNSNGKVPSSQLPSFVDDVVEGYLSGGKFYKESAHTTEISGETGKIYIDLSTEKTYRWSGNAFVVISETLALGETSSTAYRGDRGKIAYDHSQSTHARTDATKVEASSTNGNIKINGTETNVYTHPSGTNPHGTTKSDVGLGNVGNFKAVSTVANQGLTDTEKSNARTNIGAGTSSFSGSYNDLSNKPTIGNGTITIKQAGTSKGTFTMNQTGNTTIELTDNNTTYSSKSAASGGTDVSLVTTGEKYTWNNKSDLKIGTTSTTAAAGNHTHSSYVNQNAFSNVVVGSTTITADSVTDTFTLVAGTNITLTPDATNDKITISSSGGTSYTLPVATSSALGGVKSGTDITVDSSGNVSVNDDSHNHVISNVDGLQSALDGKASSSHTHTELMSKNNPTGTGSFSLNRKASTTIGTNSTAEGDNTTASGDASHSEGVNTSAVGQSSHAEGYYTIANGNYQHVQGKYNVEDTTSAFIVGNGTDTSTRSNAMTVDWNGNMTLAGTLTAPTISSNSVVGAEKPSGQSYYGMVVGGNNSNWIRTTRNGIIPYANEIGYLGANGWRFKALYVQDINASGNVTAANIGATKAGSTQIKRVPNNTTVIVEKMTLTPGLWIVFGKIVYPNNSKGRRYVDISGLAQQSVQACANGITSLSTSWFFNVTRNTDIHLRAYQNSGGELTISEHNFDAVRIK